MKISLTELVDIVLKAGVSKATRVSQIQVRNLEEYAVAKDFYKQLRDAIVAAHKHDKPKEVLDDLHSKLRDSKKLPRYKILVASYRKWWGKKDISWFQPPSAIYSYSNVQVAVNPELGIVFPTGERFVVKLYFKDKPLKRQSADLITSLMVHTLNMVDAKAAVLDVERGKLFLQHANPASLMRMIEAELAYVAHMTTGLDKAA